MATKRLFKGADSFMIESARDIYTLYLGDEGAFTAYSSRFGPTYAADFIALVDAAEATESDSTRRAQGVVNAVSIEERMEHARSLYRRLKNYAELTYPNNAAKVGTFTKGYREASRSQRVMVNFLEELGLTIAQNMPELTDPTRGGMPATFPTQIQAAYQALNAENMSQNNYNKLSEEVTFERIDALNAAYIKMMEICNTAQVIFEHLPAKRGNYTYKPYTNPADTTRYTGTIDPGKTISIATLPYRAAQLISFENTGTVGLLFDIAKESLPDEPESLAGNLVDLAGGATLTHPMQWLNADLDEDMQVKILAYNPSTTTAGSYEVNVNNE